LDGSDEVQLDEDDGGDEGDDAELLLEELELPPSTESPIVLLARE